jgi:uridine phosphorylase
MPFRRQMARLIADYEALFTLLDAFPADRHDEAGACGFWSARQTLAHLAGWLAEAERRYSDFDAGVAGSMRYQVDACNAAVVARMDALSWEAMIAAVQAALDRLAAHGYAVAPERAAADPRYGNWADVLARDCRDHTRDLARFALLADVPILEHDATARAIIQPEAVIVPMASMPERVVLTFFNDVIEAICGDGRAEVIAHIRSEMAHLPIYRLETENGPVAVANPGVGAAYAAASLEELIARGGRRFIACGGAGVLDHAVVLGHIMVPEAAIRDEGASYHYLPPTRAVRAHPDAVAAIVAALEAAGAPYDRGLTWTTDGIYRETPARIRRRRAEGALAVEMEAAALFAVAQFRGVALGQMLYSGDSVGGEEWDHRGWQRRGDIRTSLFWLAVDAVQRL